MNPGLFLLTLNTIEFVFGALANVAVVAGLELVGHQQDLIVAALEGFADVAIEGGAELGIMDLLAEGR